MPDLAHLLTISVLSALRVPSVYADPDHFDIFRKDHPRWHPIFGAGAHRCVGEVLARVEMEEILATIARWLVGAFPRLAPGPIRQVDRMEVDFCADSNVCFGSNKGPQLKG